jgi:hypothetical protein
MITAAEVTVTLPLSINALVLPDDVTIGATMTNSL